MKILEIKRHLNKPDETYLCDLYKWGDDYVVLKYVNEQPARVGSITFDIGSTTYAYYRNGGGYVLWKMYGSTGHLKGYLFHICKNQKVKSDRVEYLDLLLDLWIDAAGRLTVLDRDEVEVCAAEGVIGAKELAWIDLQEHEIAENAGKIISDFDRLQGI
jgi:predicted RNA-binding protein associated with RNAse of E/G family